MTYQEIYDMIVKFKISDKEDLTFKSAVIIMYGLQNNTTCKSKIKRETGYPCEEINFIFHNLIANEIILKERWNFEDINSETNSMEFILCSMAGAGQTIRQYQFEELQADEKPIKWNDLYKSEYRAKAFISEEVVPEDTQSVFTKAKKCDISPLPNSIFILRIN